MTTAPTFADRLVFVDVETVCLQPGPGSVWEVAAMLPGDDTPRVAQVVPDLSLANLDALAVGRFTHRYTGTHALDGVDLVYWVHNNIPHGAVIVGSNPQFDIAHLEAAWPDDAETTPPWHYHPCDLPSLVTGVTGRWPDADGSLSLAWAAEVVSGSTWTTTTGTRPQGTSCWPATSRSRSTA